MAKVKKVGTEIPVQHVYYIDEEEQMYYLRVEKQVGAMTPFFVSLATGDVYFENGSVARSLTPLPIGTKLELIL